MSYTVVAEETRRDRGLLRVNRVDFGMSALGLLSPR
jgi:hypothetical protein